MKEIDGQLYGYSYELDKTSEDDLTTCYAVDNGKVYVAFGGIWYEQPTRWTESSGSGGGGSDLPEVTADDNGDVLTVVEGAWSKATPSGSGVLVVTAIEIIDGAKGETKSFAVTYRLDKTAGEIYSAAQTGMVVMHMAAHEPNIDIFSATSYSYSEESGYGFNFSSFVGDYSFFAASASDYPISTD